jgi:hypothetical protein
MLCDTCITIFESEPDTEGECKWDGKDNHLTIETLREVVFKGFNICWGCGRLSPIESIRRFEDRPSHSCLDL